MATRGTATTRLPQYGRTQTSYSGKVATEDSQPNETLRRTSNGPPTIRTTIPPPQRARGSFRRQGHHRAWRPNYQTQHPLPPKPSAPIQVGMSQPPLLRRKLSGDGEHQFTYKRQRQGDTVVAEPIQQNPFPPPPLPTRFAVPRNPQQSTNTAGSSQPAEAQKQQLTPYDTRPTFVPGSSSSPWPASDANYTNNSYPNYPQAFNHQGYSNPTNTFDNYTTAAWTLYPYSQSPPQGVAEYTLPHTPSTQHPGWSSEHNGRPSRPFSPQVNPPATQARPQDLHDPPRAVLSPELVNHTKHTASETQEAIVPKPEPVEAPVIPPTPPLPARSPPPPLPTRSTPKKAPKPVVKHEPREDKLLEQDPSPIRRLITTACQFYPIPDSCSKQHPDWAVHRKRFVREKVAELKAKGLKIKDKPLFRQDGMVLEWTSLRPVWSDTLLPNDLASAINDIRREMTPKASPGPRQTATPSTPSSLRRSTVHSTASPSQLSKTVEPVLPAHPRRIIRPSQAGLPTPKPPKRIYEPVRSKMRNATTAPTPSQIDKSSSSVKEDKGKGRAVNMEDPPPPLPTLPTRPQKPSSTQIALKPPRTPPPPLLSVGSSPSMSFSRSSPLQLPPIATLQDPGSSPEPESSGFDPKEPLIDELEDSSVGVKSSPVQLRSPPARLQASPMRENLHLPMSLPETKPSVLYPVRPTSEEEVKSVVQRAEEYILRYMKTFDEDRLKLEMAYAVNAKFSATLQRTPGQAVSAKAEAFCARHWNPPEPNPYPFHFGRSRILDRLRSLGSDHRFDYKKDWKPPIYDLVIQSMPGLGGLPPRETILVTVHGNAVSTPPPSTRGIDHVVSVDQTFVLCKPEEMTLDELEDPCSSEIDGFWKEERWPLMALSHQMLIRDRPMLFPEEVEEASPWISKILDMPWDS